MAGERSTTDRGSASSQQREQVEIRKASSTPRLKGVGLWTVERHRSGGYKPGLDQSQPGLSSEG